MPPPIGYITGKTVAGGFSLKTVKGEQHFGSGCMQKLPHSMNEHGVTRALLVGSGTARSMVQLKIVEKVLGGLCIGICAEATHQIYPATVSIVVERARALKADCIVTVGGGGPVGYGKFAVHHIKAPLFCLVTTYSGSEMTCGQGSISNGVKTMTVDEGMRPAVRFYDTDLMMSLPVDLSVVSGMNAMAHAVEALYSPQADRFSSMVAEEAIRVMAVGLTALRSCESKGLTAQVRGISVHSAAISVGSVVSTLHSESVL
jgi:maleylacetate reductase